MKRTLPGLYLAVAAALGCGDNLTTASVSGAFPTDVFLGRQVQVLVSGSATDWTDGATVDFGEGIEVTDVRVASSSAVLATITVDPGADQGPRDVVVSDNGETFTLPGVFSVSSPLLVTTQGDIAQGSIALVHVRNRDILNPFDATRTGDGLFEPFAFPNVSADASDGLNVSITGVEPFAIELTLTIDVNAPSDLADITIESGPDGAELRFPGPGAVEVAAREPTPLAAEDIATFSIDAPFGSALFSLAPSSLSIIEALTLTDDPSAPLDAAPAFALLGPSGTFRRLRSFSDFAANGGVGPFYLVYWDNSGAFGYDADLLAIATTALGVAEVEPNDSASGAQTPASLPAILTPATLSGLTDVDTIAIDVGIEDLTKTIRVLTFGDDPLTDPMIDILDPEGNSVVGGPVDFDFHEDAESDPLEQTGTYLIQILASDFGTFDPAHGTYETGVMLLGDGSPP